MAIIKTGAIVTDIRGKLGGHFFSRNKSSAFMATKYKPKRSVSFDQMFQRQNFKTVLQLWRNLTTAQRDAWNLAAPTFPYKDRFGSSKTGSGFWLFVKINLNLVLTEQNFVLDLPSFFDVNNWYDNVTQFQWTSSVLKIYRAGYQNGEMLAIYATPMLSQGIKSYSKYFKHIINLEDFSDELRDVTQEYTQHFTFPENNSNVYFRFKQVNSSGISSVFHDYQIFDNPYIP